MRARLPCVIKWPVYILRLKPVLSFFPLCVRTFKLIGPEIVNNANVLKVFFRKAASVWFILDFELE
jgi:hypothetical protein